MAAESMVLKSTKFNFSVLLPKVTENEEVIHKTLRELSDICEETLLEVRVHHIRSVHIMILRIFFESRFVTWTGI